MKMPCRAIQRLARALSALLLAVLTASCVYALAVQTPPQPSPVPPPSAGPTPTRRPAAPAQPTQAPIPGVCMPVEIPAPSPAQTQEVQVSGALPASQPVDDAWFADAAFVGDSRTEGLLLYTSLKAGGGFAYRGLTVQSARTDKVISTGGGKKTAVDALSAGRYGKVYLMLGVNELGWYNDERYYKNYADLIDLVREAQPTAQIYLQTLIPVTAEKSDASYINNPQILVYNEIIARLAGEKDAYLVDVWAEFAGEDGALDPSGSVDGVHLTKACYGRWLEYLKTHTART